MLASLLARNDEITILTNDLVRVPDQYSFSQRSQRCGLAVSRMKYELVVLGEVIGVATWLGWAPSAYCCDRSELEAAHAGKIYCRPGFQTRVKECRMYTCSKLDRTDCLRLGVQREERFPS